MKFLKDFNENCDQSVLEELQVLLKENETDRPERDNSLFEQYEHYLQKNMTGEHGKTANLIYVNTYLVLRRAMKTNNFTLFSYALFQLYSVHSNTKHHNYAKWMILYAMR